MSTELERVSTHPANVEPTTLAELIDAAITHADTQRAELAEVGDLEGLAHGLHAIREVRQKLDLLISQTDADVSRLNRETGGNAEIPGLGMLETKRRSTKQRWKSDRLYGRLVDSLVSQAVVDPDTGEIVGDERTAARMALLLRERLASCLPLTPSMQWRIGGLKDAGIDPDDWRTRERGNWTTHIINSKGISR